MEGEVIRMEYNAASGELRWRRADLETIARVSVPPSRWRFCACGTKAEVELTAGDEPAADSGGASAMAIARAPQQATPRTAARCDVCGRWSVIKCTEETAHLSAHELRHADAGYVCERCG